MMPFGHHWGYQAGGIGGMSYGWIFGIIQLLLIIVAVIYVVKLFRKSKTDPVLEQLQLKYVKGEISEEEYLRKKEVIQK